LSQLSCPTIIQWINKRRIRKGKTHSFLDGTFGDSHRLLIFLVKEEQCHQWTNLGSPGMTLVRCSYSRRRLTPNFRMNEDCTSYMMKYQWFSASQLWRDVENHWMMVWLMRHGLE
jgi:hypothetical protein